MTEEEMDILYKVTLRLHAISVTMGHYWRTANEELGVLLDRLVRLRDQIEEREEKDDKANEGC